MAEPGDDSLGPDAEAPLLEAALETLSQGGRVLYLVPTPGRAETVRQTLLADLADGVLAGPQVLSFEECLTALYARCRRQRSLLPPQALHLLLTDILAADAARYPWLMGGRPNAFAGLVRQLVRLWSDLLASGRSPEDLQKTALECLSADQRSELSTLLHSAQKRLKTPWLARQALLPAVLDGLDGPGFEAFCKEIDLLCLEESPADLHSPAEALYRRLADAAPRVLRLGQQATPAPAPQQTLTACPDRLAEVEHIAATARRLADAGIRPQDICIALADPHRYTALWTETLPRYGLTAPAQWGLELSRSPLIVALMALLEVVADQYSRSSMLRLLNLPYVALRYRLGDQDRVLEASDLQQGVLDRVAPQSRRGWLQAIRQRQATLQRDLQRARAGTLRPDDEIETARLLTDLEAHSLRLDRLDAALTVLFDILAPLETALSLADFAAHWRRAAQQLGLLQHLQADAPDAALQSDARALARFDRLLDDLQLIAPLLGKRRLPLPQLLEMTRQSVAAARFWPRPATPSDIPLLPLAEAAHHPCRHLLIGGLTQDAWPQRTDLGLFLTDDERPQLDLPTSASQQAADERLFFRLLKRPSVQVHLFYPRADAGSDLAPSPLLAAAGLSATDRPQPTDLYTRAAFHSHVARAVLHPDGNDDLALAARGLADDAFAPALWRLAHGLKLAARRSDPAGPGPYEGILDRPTLQAAVAARYGPHHAFSITQLETYARCPFAFFAGRLLNAQPARDPEADLTALDRGNLVHFVLYRFYTENAIDQRLQPEDRPGALDNLQSLAHEAARDRGLDDFFWRRELARIAGWPEGERQVGLLPRFIDLETDAQGSALPALFEVSFGTDPSMQGQSDAHSTRQALVLEGPDGQSVRLFGKIDRIDRTPEGRFMVVDYKTGRMLPRLDDIRKGLSLQLPVYLLAAEELLGDAGLTEGIGGVYYQMRDHQDCGPRLGLADKDQRGEAYSTRSPAALPHDEYRQLLQDTRQRVLAYAAQLRQGRFPLTPHPPEKACAYCEYRRACRVDPQRQRQLRRRPS